MPLSFLTGKRHGYSVFGAIQGCDATELEESSRTCRKKISLEKPVCLETRFLFC